jgi:hypothetical protein
MKNNSMKKKRYIKVNCREVNCREVNDSEDFVFIPKVKSISNENKGVFSKLMTIMSFGLF